MLDRGQRRDLAAPLRFPYLAYDGYMKIDDVTKGLEAGDGKTC
ncbi:hypothetical protein [Cognatiyoonia sp. IB215446]|nr:hypothetical protein [Cognatiyoonia sp. IB215446]